MTSEPGKTSAASIRAKLLALAQASGEDYQRVLGRFAIERFLYRLGNSSQRSLRSQGRYPLHTVDGKEVLQKWV